MISYGQIEFIAIPINAAIEDGKESEIGKLKNYKTL